MNICDSTLIAAESISYAIIFILNLLKQQKVVTYKLYQ